MACYNPAIVRRSYGRLEGLLNENVIVLKQSFVYIVLLPAAFLAGLAVGYMFWGRSAQGQDPPMAEVMPTTSGEAASEEQQRFNVPVDDDPFLGPVDAPIVIIEFSDFLCGYCRKWYNETLWPLMEMYPDQIRFVYRDYPVLSQESFRAALAANCANEQGAFWDFHDALFSGRETIGPTAYSKYAQELGLDVQSFQDCVESERYAEEVTADARFAASLGLTGTPTFFINGIPLVGAQPLVRFTMIIDNELNK